MTATDQRTALWLVRSRLADNITRQRTELAKLCGCERCGNSAMRVEMQDRIHKNLKRLADINDQITDRD